jgi:hypothetical protein
LAIPFPTPPSIDKLSLTKELIEEATESNPRESIIEACLLK